MAKNLREWIREIGNFPGELNEVTKEINPLKYEASAILEKLDRQSSYPAVIYQKVKNVNGDSSQFRLLMNAFATTTKIGVALGLKNPTRLQIMNRYNQGQAGPLPVEVINPAEAPVMDLTMVGDQVDLRLLPIPRINQMDGGPYLTPIIVTRDPASGRYNVSWNRSMYIDRNHLGIWMSPRHLWSIFMRVEEEGGSLPVAFVLGHHPAFFLVGAGITPLTKDEYEVAGGILGERLRVTESRTFGNRLFIPADAEIVLEGEIVAGKRTIEGPFGEYTGYNGPQRLSWLVEVKAINARRDGILLTIFGAHQDNIYAHYPIQADIFANLKTVIPGVQDVSWVDSGGPLQIIISMKKKTEGEPLRAALQALSLSNLVKHVIVVDDDIDPGNLKQVMWALTTRVQADRDVNILKGAQGQVLDPSLEEEIRGSNMIIDATRPSGRPYATKAVPPEEVVAGINLDDFFTR